jgi:NAD(P)-dependent dehydrogenase (short-subunit alcohol dehydrogenase family)
MVGKVAVVTGSNKGIGFAIVKGLLQQNFGGDVLLTARNEERGLAAVEQLQKVRNDFDQEYLQKILIKH